MLYSGLIVRKSGFRVQRGRHYVLKIPGTGRFWWWAAFGAGLTVILLLLLTGEKSLLKVLALYREQRHLVVQTEELKNENQKLRQQIDDLKHAPRAIERIAREELGMVREDEIVYRFVPPEMAREKRE